MKKGDRIAQLVLEKVCTPAVEEVQVGPKGGGREVQLGEWEVVTFCTCRNLRRLTEEQEDLGPQEDLAPLELCNYIIYYGWFCTYTKLLGTSFTYPLLT